MPITSSFSPGAMATEDQKWVACPWLWQGGRVWTTGNTRTSVAERRFIAPAGWPRLPLWATWVPKAEEVCPSEDHRPFFVPSPFCHRSPALIPD